MQRHKRKRVQGLNAQAEMEIYFYKCIFLALEFGSFRTTVTVALGKDTSILVL
jgi:hypothetical protein